MSDVIQRMHELADAYTKVAERFEDEIDAALNYLDYLERDKVDIEWYSLNGMLRHTPLAVTPDVHDLEFN